MLSIKNSSIVNSEGKKILLHKRYGQKELDNFTSLYRNNFIKESDFKNISSLGFNCIRLPFNYRLIENETGIKILKEA